MPWISAKSADKLVLGQLGKLEVGKALRVESFKGDRWVEIVKEDTDSFKVVESGFKKATYERVTFKDLKMLLKRIFDDEFPRSHQLRVSVHEG
ncbi:hypothetical protein [Stygiolobus caldivivus]|uniref:Uncharacterized protein n=1 Tax=Stygiolobus caldivivus TaxID=2824673 RepID=A0A8D5ZIK5_9CREN|nr:hypothetical protein [Stygiolobus caldivivus]BCU69480.1 hypothetical protein KN1_07770 [Stygiolobus caldivivus]